MSVLYRVTNNDNNRTWISTYDDYNDYEPDQCTVEPATLETATAAELCELMDDELASENYHSMVGVHAGLAKLIAECAGVDMANVVLRKVYDAGGVMNLKR